MADSLLQMIEEISRLVRGTVKSDEPMSKHTTFCLGGPADIYIEPADADDLAKVMSWVHKLELPWFIFGDGANLLVADKGIRGVVIKLGKPFSGVRIDGEVVTVGSAVKLDKLVSITSEAGLAGLEYAAAIPGTVGGAIVMNAGTYLGQVGDVIEQVSVVTNDGRRLAMTPEDLQFRYRWSVFQEDSGKIIVEAIMRLKTGNRAELVKVAEDLRLRRATNLPCGRSAGCVFKNPGGEFSAGQLIDKAGLKGLSVGDAYVADKHANFIMNSGNATAADVKALADKVRGIIRDQFGVELIYEVRIVGDW